VTFLSRRSALFGLAGAAIAAPGRGPAAARPKPGRHGKIVFIDPVPLFAHSAMDYIVNGLNVALEDRGIDLRVMNDDTIFTKGHDYPTRSIRRAIDAGIRTIGFYVVDPLAGAAAVADARRAGIAVFTIGMPSFPVDASLVYPGFNQGVLMMQFLLNRLPPGARVGIIGGPDALTAAEEVAGLAFAAKRNPAYVLVNDPELPRYRNLTEDRAGGRAAALRLFSDFDGLSGLIPYNDESLLGALDAIDALKLPHPPLMVSRNGSPRAIEMIRAGRSEGSWDLDAPGVGRQFGALLIDRILSARIFDQHIEMTPVGAMVTRENLANWVPWGNRTRATRLKLGLD
jgi:ABC-type sugar transport system substrate-binding protein